MEEGVAVDFFWTLSQAIASHVGCNHVESGFCECIQLMAPRIPRFGKTMTQHHQRAGPAFSDVHADTVSIYLAMFYFAHCKPQFDAVSRVGHYCLYAPNKLRIVTCAPRFEQPEIGPLQNRLRVDIRHTKTTNSPLRRSKAPPRRPMKTLLSVVIFLVVASLAAQGVTEPAGLHERTVSEKDLFDFVWVANPELSPDGTRVAFTRVGVDEKRTGYETSIWTAAANGNEAPVRMTNGKHDAQPRWSPDGKYLVLIRGGDKEETGKPNPPQLAMLSLAGGEARTITELLKGASNPVWSPDGRRIAFLSSTTQEDIQKDQRKKNAAKAGDTKASDGEHESDVHVISRAEYRSNDQGYLDPKRHAHIWMLQAPTTSDELISPVQLTSGNFDEREVVWSRDGTRIYFLTNRVDEPYYELPSTDIYSVASAGGSTEKLATVPMYIGDLVLSPDGRKLAFHGSLATPIRSYSQPDLWLMDVAPDAKPTNLTADYDFDMGSSVFGDNAAPRGGHGRRLYWSPDGRSLFDIAEKQGCTPIVRVDTQTGTVTDITRGNQAVLDYSVNPNASAIVALVSTPLMIGDLFVVRSDGTQTRITDFNHQLWSQLNLTAPEEINYTSFDGKRIQGWIQKPPDFDAQKKYPLILNIHGGPHAAYGWVFDHEFQWMAAKGYVVLYVNPRGSTS